MLIHCPECRTGFRFEKRWMRGFKGARIRCRNCGSTIVVLNPSGAVPSPPRVEGPAVPAESGTPSSIGLERKENFGNDPGEGRVEVGENLSRPAYNNGGEPWNQPEGKNPESVGEVSGVPPETGESPGVLTEARQEETTPEEFDISERITEEPDGPLYEMEGDSPPLETPYASAPFPDEDVYAPPVEVLSPGQREPWSPEPPASGFPASRAYSPRSTYKVVTDFALITVVLVFGGVCGYFALRYILSVIGVELG